MYSVAINYYKNRFLRISCEPVNESRIFFADLERYIRVALVKTTVKPVFPDFRESVDGSRKFFVQKPFQDQIFLALFLEPIWKLLSFMFAWIGLISNWSKKKQKTCKLFQIYTTIHLKFINICVLNSLYDFHAEIEVSIIFP